MYEESIFFLNNNPPEECLIGNLTDSEEASWRKQQKQTKAQNVCKT